MLLAGEAVTQASPDPTQCPGKPKPDGDQLRASRGSFVWVLALLLSGEYNTYIGIHCTSWVPCLFLSIYLLNHTV